MNTIFRPGWVEFFGSLDYSLSRVRFPILRRIVYLEPSPAADLAVLKSFGSPNVRLVVDRGVQVVFGWRKKREPLKDVTECDKFFDEEVKNVDQLIDMLRACSHDARLYAHTRLFHRVAAVVISDREGRRKVLL